MIKTISARNAQSDFMQLLHSAIKGHRQYRIASDEGSAILLSEDEYESMVKKLKLSSVSNKDI